MVLSERESNNGIKFIPRLAIFNPELISDNRLSRNSGKSYYNDNNNNVIQ